jgi:hypothetical protein
MESDEYFQAESGRQLAGAFDYLLNVVRFAPIAGS